MTYEEQATEYRRLRTAITEADSVVEQRKADLLEFQKSISPVAPGDIVEDTWRSWTKGDKTMKVTKVRYSYIRPNDPDGWMSKPSVSAVRKLKDGSWGSREFDLNSWRMIEKASPDAPVP